MADKHVDPSMAKVRALFDKSGLSLHDLGLKMGYAPEIARQSAFQFLKASDPRVSMLRRFAEAVGVPLEVLTAVRKSGGVMKRLTREEAEKGSVVERIRLRLEAFNIDGNLEPWPERIAELRKMGLGELRKLQRDLQAENLIKKTATDTVVQAFVASRHAREN